MPSSTSLPPPGVLDLLATRPSPRSFAARVDSLRLSDPLRRKVLQCEAMQSEGRFARCESMPSLDSGEERELATEMLRCRHRFSELLLTATRFRQAALTVIQNIYLFKTRRIFFAPPVGPPDGERQEALLLFSAGPAAQSLPLAKTLQHAIIARVWNRITSRQDACQEQDPRFLALEESVEALNTLRNIYILLTRGLVQALVFRAKTTSWSQSTEDAVQSGTFGVARAAYRYHPSCGVRFSTFATHWINREIQQQALSGRLIRVSSTVIEAHARAKKRDDQTAARKYGDILQGAHTLLLTEGDTDTTALAETVGSTPAPETILERRQLHRLLLDALDSQLDPKKREVLKRRFGIFPYNDGEESVLDISRRLGVTRSSVYQLEESALRQLHRHLTTVQDGPSGQALVPQP